MTMLFAVLTVFALLLVALFAQATGLAATSYFVLLFAFGTYLLWCGRKQSVLVPVTQGN